MALVKNIRNQSLIKFDSLSGIQSVEYSTDANPSGASIDGTILRMHKGGDTTPGLIPNYSFDFFPLTFKGYNECNFYDSFPNAPDPTDLTFDVNIRCCRVGQLVTVTLDAVTFNASLPTEWSDKVMSLAGALPSIYRPHNNSIFIIGSYTTDTVPRYMQESDEMGALRINSAGTIEVWRRLTFNSTWNQSQAGWNSISITYIV